MVVKQDQPNEKNKKDDKDQPNEKNKKDDKAQYFYDYLYSRLGIRTISGLMTFLDMIDIDKPVSSDDQSFISALDLQDLNINAERLRYSLRQIAAEGKEMLYSNGGQRPIAYFCFCGKKFDAEIKLGEHAKAEHKNSISPPKG